MENQVFTVGEFAKELEAMAEFDRIMIANGSFKVHKEVPGEYIQPRADTEKKNARIDRLLIPLGPAIEAGWRHGAIGIEGKCSQRKIGRLVSQALDYSRCAWSLESGVPGLLLLTRWVFVYPADPATEDIGSIMAQNRIGTCNVRRNRLIFTCGGTNGIMLGDDGSVVVHELPMGGKRGSR